MPAVLESYVSVSPVGKCSVESQKQPANFELAEQPVGVQALKRGCAVWAYTTPVGLEMSMLRGKASKAKGFSASYATASWAVSKTKKNQEF
jgi:hypothetical protein